MKLQGFGTRAHMLVIFSKKLKHYNKIWIILETNIYKLFTFLQVSKSNDISCARYVQKRKNKCLKKCVFRFHFDHWFFFHRAEAHFTAQKKKNRCFQKCVFDLILTNDFVFFCTEHRQCHLIPKLYTNVNNLYMFVSNIF